jgi:hypothetical protein
VFHWSSEDLDLGGKQIGEVGSEVSLKMVEALPKRRRKKRKGGEILKGSPEVLAGTLVERLKEWQIL